MLINQRYEVHSDVTRDGARVIDALDRLCARPMRITVRRTTPSELPATIAQLRRLIGPVEHANVAKVRDVFALGNGEYAVASDPVPGSTLRDILNEQGSPGLTFRRVRRFLDDAANAIEHLHRMTPPIALGDLTPSNFIVTPRDRLVLVDLGSDGPTVARRAKRFGTVAAPELLAGEEPAPATDVYGLGAMAATLLTGAVPLMGETPDLGSLPRRRAARIERIIARSMSLDAARRPAAPREVADGLHRRFVRRRHI
jgi:serine/threonine-protein kinase